MILDDVFSGLDATTIHSVVESLFGQHGYFRKYRTSVILATHNRRFYFSLNVFILTDSSKSSPLCG